MTSVATPIERFGPLENFEHGFNRVIVSSDERYIATSDVDMNVIVREHDRVVFEHNLSSDNEKIKPTERIRGMKFSPSGEYLYVAAGSILTAWRTEGWEIAWTYEAPRSFGFLIISPIALDVAETGDVAVAFDNGSIVVWNADGRPKAKIQDNDSPRWLRFMADGKSIVGSDSFSLAKWDVDRRKRSLRIQLRDRVFGLDVDTRGGVAITRTLQDIVLWDLDRSQILKVLPIGPGAPVVALDSTSRRMAYAERNHVRVVNYEGVLLDEFFLDVASALSMVFLPESNELLVGCTERVLARFPLG